VQHTPVRGPGSNQHQDKPPATTTAPPPASSAAAATAQAAVASPFAAPSGAAPAAEPAAAQDTAAAWREELEQYNQEHFTENLNALRDEQMQRLEEEAEQGRKYLEDNPVGRYRTPEQKAAEGAISKFNSSKQAIATGYPAPETFTDEWVHLNKKSGIAERARADVDRLASMGLPTDAAILNGPGDYPLGEMVRQDPETGLYNLEIHHEDGAVEHMADAGYVKGGRGRDHSSIITDQGNEYWLQRGSQGQSWGPFAGTPGESSGNWPHRSTIIVRRPLDTTAETRFPREGNTMRSFGWIEG